MAVYVLETNLVGNLDDVDDVLVAPFRNALDVMSGGAIQVAPMTNLGNTGQVMMDRLLAGTTQFAYGSANRFQSTANPLLFAHLFGMEVAEFCSWYYAGGGRAHLAAQVAGLTPPKDNFYMFPINVGPGESGGWYKETVSMKKMLDGRWSDGSAIKIRLADECGPVHGLAFPNVVYGSGTPSVSFLNDVKAGLFNGGELFTPLGDASTVNGLFPSWPTSAGSIIDAGVKHFYMQTWQTPFRGRCLFVNKTWFDLLPADQQEMLTSAAAKCHMQNVSYLLQGQDAIIKQFQTLGGVIHERLPTDYLTALRSATDEIYRRNVTADSSNLLGSTMAHQRDFIRKNRVRWQSGNLDRAWRFKGRTSMGIIGPNNIGGYESDLHPDSIY